MSYLTEPTYHLSDDVDPVLGMAAMRHAVLMCKFREAQPVDRAMEVRDASAVLILRDPLTKERRKSIRANAKERFGMPFMEFALTVHDEQWAVTLLSNGDLRSATVVVFGNIFGSVSQLERDLVLAKISK